LQSARLLARHGVPVIGLADDLSHFCCRTKVCQRIVAAPLEGDGLVRALHQLGPTLPERGVLFPCTDLSVLAISKARQSLDRWFHIRLPSHEAVETLMDKLRFYEYARRTGLPVPQTRILRSREDALAAASELCFPCILKPPVKTPLWQRHATGKVYKAATADELLAVYDRASAWADELMVQEWIEGTDEDLYSCNCYFDDAGEPLVTFIARKLRQWPPETGTSCLGEECRNDDVLRTALALFRGADYRGLGYLEMKRDRRTGRHWIIEPNIGRPTGRSAIAEAGGVELLFTKYCECVGRPLPANREQKYGGARWIYWRRDVQSALHYWRRGELTLRDWFRSWRGLSFDAVFAWSDQGPFWADLWHCLRLVASRRRQASAVPNRPTADAHPVSPALAKDPGIPVA
jgi:predicted ATP-grasp superfamily ATP-dependent carboligase